MHKDILRAQNMIGLADYSEAIKLYQRILEKTPPEEIQVKINYQMGDLYSIYLAEYEKGIKHYKRVIELSEDPLWLVKAEERIGEINFSFLKDYKTSRESYRKLVDFKPRLSRQDYYQFQMALCSHRLENNEMAIKEFLAIQSNSQHEYFISSFFHLGSIYFHMKDWRTSIFYLKEYLKRETRKENIVQAKFLMANAYETQERLKTAYNIYYSILGEYPNTDVIQNRLNAIYARRVARKR
jgi:tetratricopeptide (TPR) repeat protein